MDKKTHHKQPRTAQNNHHIRATQDEMGRAQAQIWDMDKKGEDFKQSYASTMRMCHESRPQTDNMKVAGHGTNG